MTEGDLTYRIATIPGDGVGPEVVAAARRVLDAGSADNALALLSRGVPLAAGGSACGFEIVGFEGGLNHSFRCTNAHVSAEKIGVHLNRFGLFERESDADAALEWSRTAKYSLEEGVWVVVQIVEYPGAGVSE